MFWRSGAASSSSLLLLEKPHWLRFGYFRLFLWLHCHCSVDQNLPRQVSTKSSQRSVGQAMSSLRHRFFDCPDRYGAEMQNMKGQEMKRGREGQTVRPQTRDPAVILEGRLSPGACQCRSNGIGPPSLAQGRAALARLKVPDSLPSVWSNKLKQKLKSKSIH